MTQNIVSLNLTDDQLQAVDAALTELETQLGGLIALSVPQKRSLRKMGEKSEAFCRQAMLLLSQNPELVPANVLAAGPVQDLAMLDRLRPRLLRLTRLAERASDTDVALGSDVMVASLQVYGQLKLTGASEGLQSLRRDLGMRFARTSKAGGSEGGLALATFPHASLSRSDAAFLFPSLSYRRCADLAHG